MAALTLDAGPLILGSRNVRSVWRLLNDSVLHGHDLFVPSAALAQAWRGGPRSARLSQLLGLCEIKALDERLAKLTGELLGKSGSADLADASVVVTAADTGTALLTSDPGDLRFLIGFVGRVDVVDVRELR